MGSRFDDLPEVLKRFHSVDGALRFAGHVIVDQGGTLARSSARLVSFPKRSGRMPFSLTVTREGERELWERSFDGHITKSVQWCPRPGIVAERLGPMTLALAPRLEGETLNLPVVGITGLGVPLPRWLLTFGGGQERVGDAGEVEFDVSATARVVGQLIRYQGSLIPA